MGKWKCANEDCPTFDEVETVPIEKIIVVDGSVVSDALECPVCGKDRIEIREQKGPSRISLHGKNLSNS